MDDFLHALVVTELSNDRKSMKMCGCLIFISSPPPHPGRKRSIKVKLVDDMVTESVAFINEDAAL